MVRRPLPPHGHALVERVEDQLIANGREMHPSVQPVVGRRMV